MFYKIKKSSKAGVQFVLLIIIILFFAGCALKTTVKPGSKDVQKASELNLITDISVTEDADSIVVLIKSDRLLTYTSVKQPFPLGVLLYFPDTAIDQTETSLYPDMDIVSSVQTSELTEDGHTSRIEILLTKDTSYKVTREGEGLRILFAKESAIPTPAEPEIISEAIIGETITNEPDIKPDEESMPVATRLQSVYATKLETGVKIHLKADGKINDYKSFTIASPARIVFDLYNIESPYRKEQLVPVDTKWVKKIRYYGYPDRLRVVLDTDKSYLSHYSASNEKDGLLIHVGSDVIISKKEADASAENKQTKPAWVNRIDFSSEGAGKSTLIIGTTIPVKYKLDKATDKILQLKLYKTKLPDYRKRPLITTRFNSAVDRIMPVQTPALKDTSIITIELREAVPYFVEQTNDLLFVHFDASSIPPKPFEEADLPSWKKVMAKSTAEPEAIEEKQAEDKVLRPKVAGKYTGEKIALDFYETDIKNVFRIIREVSGKNFAIDKDVTGKVTLTLDKPVPWDQVLALVLRMNVLGMVYEGDIIRIATLETLKKEEEHRQAQKAAERTAMEQKAALEPLVTEYISVNYANANSDVLTHIEQILTKDRGTVTVDERNNQIIITDVAEKVKQARETVQKIDQVTPQVIIEARIVEASDTFSRELGTQWGITGGPLGHNQLGRLGGDLNYSMSATNPPSKGTKSLGIIGIDFTRLAGTPFSLLNAKLMASESQGLVKIISAPKILTLDNKTATIKQGLSYPFNKLDADGNTTTEFKDIALELEVTPHVTPDNRISMEINIKNNEIGAIINNQISFTTKEATTELLINDGETIVIGGIRKTRKDTGESGVPGLSKIPILGWLFKTKSKTNNLEELLIFITPKIVQLERRDR